MNRYADLQELQKNGSRFMFILFLVKTISREKFN